MKKKQKVEKSIPQLLAQIEEKLKAIEEYAAWMVRGDQRFKVGQRVQFSRKAIEQGFSRGDKRGKKGKVLAIENGFWLKVQIDGLKHPKDFHHSFFNPVSGPKLF